MTIGTFNALLEGSHCYVKAEVTEATDGKDSEKLLWLMVESDPEDEETQDVAVVCINAPAKTAVSHLIDQMHAMLLQGGTKMSIMAFQNKVEQRQAEIEAMDDKEAEK